LLDRWRIAPLSSVVLVAAMRDSDAVSPLSEIITQEADYELKDVRSIKMDSFEVRIET